MFSYLLLRYRVAKVQAELMAQIKNQEIVNLLCQSSEVIKAIDLLYKEAYYRKRQDVNFLIVCAILIMTISDKSNDRAIRELSYDLLKDRFITILRNRKYCLDNFMIVGDCEEAITQWENESKRD